MRILVMGGGWFLGRAVVERAQARGWEVTAFSRGRARLPEGVEPVRGDRTAPQDVAELARRGPWDAVIDTSGMVAAEVLASARALRDQATRYVIVSTVAAYQGWPIEPLDESSPTHACPADAVEQPAGASGDRYGYLKAGCERAVLQEFRKAAVVLRPGVILGPHEYIGRLPWWLRRIAQGGRVLAPGDPERSIQPVDVRDVADFALHTATNGPAGVMNVTAPIGSCTFGRMLHACRAVTGSDAEFVWAQDDFLLGEKVAMWTELPLWRTFPGTWRISDQRAAAAGLRCRPIEETVADTWAWMQADGTVADSPRAAEIGIPRPREEALLARWTQRARS